MIKISLNLLPKQLIVHQKLTSYKKSKQQGAYTVNKLNAQLSKTKKLPQNNLSN
jgi:hypothetical protein